MQIRGICKQLLLACFFVLTILFSKVSAESWPMLLHDSRHTGRSVSSIGNHIEIIWVSEFTKVQQYYGISGITVGPDGTIYAGSTDHYLYALNPIDGAVKWEFLTDHEIVGTPALDSNGTIYIGTKGGHVYSIDPDGTQNWNYDIGNRVTSSVTISNLDQIVVNTEDRIFSLDAEGNSLWIEFIPPATFVDGLPYGGHSSPAIGDDGTVYICGATGVPFASAAGLVALEPSGAFKWRVEISEAAFSSAAIADDGTIYCPGGHTASGDGDYDLTAVNPDGTVAWVHILPDSTYLANASIGHDGTIFIGTEDYFLNAINPDGTLKWRFLATDEMGGSSSIIGSNGVILTVPGNSQTLYAINPDGTLRWTTSSHLHFVQTPVIADDILYQGVSNGIIAYDISGSSSANNLSGTWPFSTTNNWVNPGNANCSSDVNDTGQLSITQSDDNVTAVVREEDITFTGTVTGNHLIASTSFPENGGTTVMEIDATLSSNTYATGTLTWTWSQENYFCNGGSNISLNKTDDNAGTGSTGGSGGGGGIFGDIIRDSVTGYHLDGITPKGVQVYMPVTTGFKALKGAQEYVGSFAPNLARKVRECFDYFEQKADSNKEGFLYKIGTHVFPLLGEIAEGSLNLIGKEAYIVKAYSDTTISVEEFQKLKKSGLAIAPKTVKDVKKSIPEMILMELVY